ncbi:MAG: outer membrane beta-barrel protein, partial [Bacteroidales bacterium]
YYKTPLEKSNAPSLQPLIVEAKTKSISGENQQFDPENFSRYEINQVETTETNISTLPAATFSLAEPKFYQASGIKGNRIYEINKDITERENSSTEKWKIGATLLPSYYSRFSFSQHNAGKEYIKSEKPVFSYSGGFSFSYELSRRISLSSGITYSSIGQRIDDISSYTGFLKYTDTKSSSDFSIMTASGTINSTNKDIFLLDKGNVTRIFTRYTADVFDPVKASLSHLSNSIIQDMNYIEIPFVLKYKLIDRNVDINMLGGLFYSILVGNSSYISSDGIRYIIGKTDGLSPVTLSSSVGVGMEYRLSEQITFNIEPLLRYYITPLGGLPGSIIHPYSFGILSGVFYKF